MSDVITRDVPTWTELEAAKSLLGPTGRETVTILESQAVSYVWGRQDAGESARDTGYSIEFGRAYGMHAARYEAQKVCYRNNIQTAFERWSKGQPIEKD